MPIGLGLASTHSGFTITKEASGWQRYYNRLIRNTPQPHSAALETEEVIEGYIGRMDHCFDVLRAE